MASTAPPPAEWTEPDTDLPPPEPAPSDWRPPSPVETQIEAVEGIDVQREDQAIGAGRPSRKRRFWVTTLVYVLLWLGSIALVDTGGSIFGTLILLVPLYLLTLPFVLRTPKRFRKAKARLVDRLDWQGKLMTSVVVFLILYVPFTFFSNAVIPYASLVEYALFSLLLFLLVRIAGRSTGVAPSPEALPPPSHRLHQQVVAPIDDAHYQRSLWMNFSFVEKGRGARQLARRLDDILESNGVDPARRGSLLSELNSVDDGGHFALTRRGRERRATEREQRAAVLQRLYDRLGQELENTA